MAYRWKIEMRLKLVHKSATTDYRPRTTDHQKKPPQFVTDDYLSSYETLLTSTGMTSMQIRQMHNLCIEICKTLSNLNPRYMQELFERNSSSYSTRRPNDLKIPRVNQTSYGSRSIKFEGAKLWNHLPEDTKSAEHLNTFKKLIEDWTGPSCDCNYCLYTTTST